MDHYAGIDVSLKESSVCVVDAKGKVVREVKVASEPEALVRYFGELEVPVSRIGLEAGPLSQWLHAGLVAANFEVVLLETRHVTRHVKAALSAMTVKTDRKDARGIAQLLRMGWYPRDPTRLRAEGWRGQPRPVRSAHPGTDRRICDAGNGDRRHADSAGNALA